MAPDIEARRQSALLAAIWQRAGTESTQRGDIVAPHGSARPLAPYISHAQAASAQVLAAAYPTIDGMIGGEALAVLAWRLWQTQPPVLADLNRWGQALPELIEASAELAPWPHLADGARLDWALHESTQAPDAQPALETLQRLGDTPPEEVLIRLRPDVRVIASAWPIVTLRQAQLANEVDATALIEAALRCPEPETAVVWRDGWQAQAACLPESMASWMQALAIAQTEPPDLFSLMAAQPEGFDFTAWLTLALQQGWLWRIDVKSPLA